MQKKVFQEKVEIVSNKRIAKDCFRLSLLSRRVPQAAEPGQFIQVKVSDALEPLLRRPLGVHRITANGFEVLFERVGKGTEILADKEPGEYLDVIGPLGNGFEIDETTPIRLKGRKQLNNGTKVIIAGGIGAAPLLFLAEKLAYRKILVLLGAKTKSEIVCEDEFRKLGCKIEVSTDDGSKGFKGKVTDLLKKILPLAISNKQLAIYACGPTPMLREISAISKHYNIPAQISLEEHMACGIGACLGCVVNTKEGFKRVCREGPVFKSSEIIW